VRLLALLLPVLPLALALGAPAAATASDPGRWREVRRSPIPISYYQGVAADAGRELYFDGVYTGLYRTDSQLRQQTGVDDVIPSAVRDAEGYNHIGDIDWDRSEGGRVLLPLECYYPGTPSGANTCRTGSIGVADPRTLSWRYYVKLDPAEIPKAMFCVVSPDGRLLWTSSGDDLLAYDVSQINPANAAPHGPRLKAVRRLAGAVPPSGITGAAFVGSRLYVAGTEGDTTFQVWSIDLRDGSRRLEIEREVVGESEGLVSADVLGGILHWIITPFSTTGRPPTYGSAGNQLLSFVPNAARRIELSVAPRRLRVGRRTRLVFTARRRVGGTQEPVEGATVRFAGRRVTTDLDGRAPLRVKLMTAGRYSATATLAGALPARVTVRATRRPIALTGDRAG
jgi:hypothetical protein